MKDIAWREWSDSAFEEAKQTGKPVLLDISAVWCHWCHVMDETTYSSPTVVELINSRYIPIRVDSDRNPDINTRYNMGGWPSTVFLTSDRDVLTGATYVPPDQMTALLQRLADVYDEEREELMRKASTNRSRTEAWFHSAVPRLTKWDDVDRILDSVRGIYDPEFGGFGHDQKFPHTSALALLLFNAERTGNKEDLEKVTRTLDAMIDGEIFDPIEGGMFRYATRRDWTVPHYEKILSDNAGITSVLLDAYRISGQEDFLHTAHKALIYLEGVLLDQETGAYCGSQDADEDYYKQDVPGRRQMEPPLVDDAEFIDSNCDLIMTYIKAYGIAHDHEARDKALRIVSFFNSLERGPDGTACHYYEHGRAYEYGVLSDTAFLALANTICCEATGDDAYSRTAKELIDVMIPAFISSSGALHDISEMRAKRRGLSRYTTPLHENSVAAMAMLKLAGLLGDASYAQTAREVLNALADHYPSYGIIASDYAIALTLLHWDPLVVTINADAGSEDADEYIISSISSCGINCTIRTATPEEGQPCGATVCVGSACRARVTDPTALAEELADIVKTGLKI